MSSLAKILVMLKATIRDVIEELVPVKILTDLLSCCFSPFGFT